MPIARAVRKLAQHAEKISGPDFMETFLTRFPEMPMGFIGGTPEVQKTLSQRFRLSNATFYNPPMRPFSPENAREDFEKLSVISRKNGSLPLLIWVGLGAPKQELWMQAVAKIAPQSVFLGVGAAFDFLGGRIQRAPVWMQNLGLEWFHRFLQDPRRLGPRYLRSNLRYLLKSTLD
jgi:N-acetylglucosaminyldiphosphoundecaprenol N-acetyl-beta-D-mannosaminyltransferase